MYAGGSGGRMDVGYSDCTLSEGEAVVYESGMSSYFAELVSLCNLVTCSTLACG